MRITRSGKFVAATVMTTVAVASVVTFSRAEVAPAGSASASGTAAGIPGSIGGTATVEPGTSTPTPTTPEPEDRAEAQPAPTAPRAPTSSAAPSPRPTTSQPSTGSPAPSPAAPPTSDGSNPIGDLIDMLLP